MANEIGAVLNIPAKTIELLGRMDKNLISIEKSSNKAANALKNGFSSVVVDTSKLESAITSLANKIGALNTASTAVQNVGTAMGNAAQEANKTATATNSVTQSLSGVAQTVNQLSVSRPFEKWNIAQLKSEIDNLNATLKSGKIDTGSGEQTLNKQMQQAIVDRRNALKEELKIQEASTAAQMSKIAQVAKAQNADTELHRRESEKRIKQTQKEYAEKAKLAQQTNYAKNTTVQGALDFSKTAHTLQRQVTAIEYLKKARLSLSDTDEKYRQKLEQINQAIARHNQALQQAGLQSQNLVRNQRNLWDISGQLQRQIALLFSVTSIEGYIGKIAQVRGEFELTQRSLQAILQNKTQADKIFGQVVELAVKSPFRIKDLASYAKQLAAYRIESDKLFDTTKRLADVSTGLGVDMQRLILAYGQVKAAAYLRGTEVRQFTEAGINLYGELQRYFQEVKGEAYTTAQIVDMISKRKVTFEDIENIFTRMTDKGGLFYNMQEIQSETLQGKISNLKDSLDIMLNDIGKSNESILKGSIDAVRSLLDNWESMAAVLKAAAGAFLYIKISSSLANTEIAKSIALTISYQRSLGAERFQAFFLGMQKGWQMISKAALSSIGMISKALKGAAWFALLDTTLTYFRNTANHAKRIREITEEQYKQSTAIATTVKRYNELKDAAGKLTSKEQKDTNFEERKKQLTELYAMFGNQGIEIPITLEKVTKENIDEVFNDAQEKLKTINNIVADASRKIESDKANIEIFGFTPFSESIIENTEEYSDALDDLLGNTSAIENAANIAATNYDKLNAKAKRYYDEVRALSEQHSKEEISNSEYVIKTYEALENMRIAQSRTSLIEEGYIVKIRTGLNGVRNGISSYNTELAAAQKSWDILLNSVNNSNNLIEKLNAGKITPKDFEIIIDKTATDNNFSVGATTAFKSFAETWANEMGAKGLKFEIDKGDVEDEISWVQKHFQEYFGKHKFKLKFNVASSVKTDDIEKLNKDLGEKIKTYKKNKNLIKQAKNSSERLDSKRSNEQLIKELQKENEEIYSTVKGHGRLKDLEDKKEVKAAAKAERDIWNERISVLKEMQRQYEKVREHFGEETAKALTLSEYMDDLKYVKIGKVINPEDIVPTKQGLVDALEKVLKAMPTTMKDYFKKSSELKKTISQLELEIQTDEANKKLEKTKKNIEDMFNGLDLHQKLKDAGLSEAEVQALFPGLAKTLDEVEKGIRAQYDTLRDANGKLGEKEQKDYDEYIRKLNEQRVKESQNLVIELTKAYKTRLTDQLQLDTWYAKERVKIYAKAYDEQSKTFKDVLTPEMQKEYEANLNREYQKRTSENTWKNFQATDSYISMFENMDKMSSEAIQRMLEKLESLRSSLKGLPADQVRAIINQMEKLREVQIERNPFKAAIDGIKELKEAREGLIRLDEKGESTGIVISEEEVRRLHEAADEAKVIAETKAQGENKELQDLERQREELVMYSLPEEKNTDEYKKQLSDLNQKIEAQREVVNLTITEAELQGKISKAYADQLRGYTNATDKIQKGAVKSLNMIATIANEASSAITNIAGNLENVFGTMSAGTKDTIDSISEILGGVGNMAGGVERVVANPADIGGYFQAIGGLAKTIGSLFAIGDKKKEREIQRHIKNIEKLQKAYEELKEQMDSTWNLKAMKDAHALMKRNLEMRQNSLQSMMAAEKDKKKTDWDKIEEWQQEYDAITKTLKENEESFIEALGGFGSDNRYKSAAQEFVDAWVDAYGQGEDALNALNGKWDEFVTNLIKKQSLLKVSDKIIEPFLKDIDEALEEYERTEDQQALMDRIKAISAAFKKEAPEISEMLESIYNGFDGKFKTSDNLTSLQQGIQGVTERTAEALESLLNSMRFFLATQQNDVAVIRHIMEERFRTSTTMPSTANTQIEFERDTPSPMLVELRTQTELMRRLNGNFENIMRAGHTKGGYGLKVFID